MDDVKDDVLKAEAAIRELANELARNQNLNGTLDLIISKLTNAADAIEAGKIALLKASDNVVQLTSKAEDALKQSSREVAEASEAFKSEATRLASESRREMAGYASELSSTVKEEIKSLREHAEGSLAEASRGLHDAAALLSKTGSAVEKSIENSAIRHNEVLKLIQDQSRLQLKMEKRLKVIFLVAAGTLLASLGTIVYLLLR